jgi:hypothetical protein
MSKDLRLPKPKPKQHTFRHDYPDAPGVTSSRAGAGVTPHKHPYPAGKIGDMTHPRSDAQGGKGPTVWMHSYPKADVGPSGGKVNLKGTKAPPLTHRLKKRAKGGVHTMGKRN